MASNRRPKLAFFDIETYPMLIAAWTQFEANAIWVEQDTHLLSFAVKWAGSSPIPAATFGANAERATRRRGVL